MHRFCFFCLSAYKWIYGELKGNVPFQYLAWVSYPVILVVFASLFCHLVSPQAIGELSVTCQPRFFQLNAGFLFVCRKLTSPEQLRPCFLSLSFSVANLLHLSCFFLSVFFFFYRFWDSRAENHPERRRPEGISHPQSLHS